MTIPPEKLAAACFAENIQQLGDPRTQPEKYNLYNGLRAMADSIEALAHEVHRIDQRLNAMQQKLEDLSR